MGEGPADESRPRIRWRRRYAFTEFVARFFRWHADDAVGAAESTFHGAGQLLKLTSDIDCNSDRDCE